MILYVDDDRRGTENNVKVIRDAGFQVELLTDIDSALAYFTQNADQVALIILDSMMASGNSFKDEETQEGLLTGVRFFERIRGQKPRQPVIILTIRTLYDVELEPEPDGRLKIFNKLNSSSKDLLKEVRHSLTISPK
jgi:CheY-like chemotaxis protein